MINFMRTKKRLFVAVVFVFSALFASGCNINWPFWRVGPRPWSGVYDHYGEYRLVLPFTISNTHFAGFHYFDTDYTYEQMKQALIDAGYEVELYEFDGAPRLLIFAEHRRGTAVFVIFDDRVWNYEWYDNIGSLRFAVAAPIMEPVHIADMSTSFWEDDVFGMRIFKPFDYVAAFYKRAARNVVVDDVNMTITFVHNSHGSITTAQWSEDSDGNYWLRFNFLTDRM